MRMGSLQFVLDSIRSSVKSIVIKVFVPDFAFTTRERSFTNSFGCTRASITIINTIMSLLRCRIRISLVLSLDISSKIGLIILNRQRTCCGVRADRLVFFMIWWSWINLFWHSTITIYTFCFVVVERCFDLGQLYNNTWKYRYSLRKTWQFARFCCIVLDNMMVILVIVARGSLCSLAKIIVIAFFTMATLIDIILRCFMLVNLRSSIKITRRLLLFLEGLNFVFLLLFLQTML